VGGQQRLPGRALQGREAELPAGIVADNELHKPIAEVAHTVEQNGGGSRHNY
jgi:hypothetical protein